ncbi:MAG: FAD-dependent monooxygenase [Bacteroidota bacterium]|nr:FAD-dependent monooxygenase [Bacteroidota bacterium]MDP4231647.1 FAD-dependent monooxygenase [Bacteroidota bacterium]MDP4236027.1 FAD-dependent monooxygenase [Bacteroidota bacterium]
MRISIIGGGPAGLYFAILAKKNFPNWIIEVAERNGPNDTFGWGVVFSDRTLQYLEEYDKISHDEIVRQFETWENVDVVHCDERVTIGGNKFSGISRLVMLNILQARCEELGVSIQYHKEITDLNAVKTSDLIIVADGVNSIIRRSYPSYFEPELSSRSNKYIWFGTHKLFHALTLTFRENEAGVFASHSYKFNKTTSTFVVECDPETWEKAGFASMTEDETRAYLEKVFEKDLSGNPLLSNRSMWINFLLVKNRHWVHDNIVIMGDAAHTAHFSIGSGTKLALEDAIALFKELKTEPEVKLALVNYESNRKPKVEEYQQFAYDSLVLFENLPRYMDLTPLEMAYKMMTRSKKLTHEKLRQRDPEFVANYEKVVLASK